MNNNKSCAFCGCDVTETNYGNPGIPVDEMIDQLDNLVFWADDLLRLARELQRDLKKSYEPIKGWPPHIDALEGITDYDTAIAAAKEFLSRRQPPAAK